MSLYRQQLSVASSRFLHARVSWVALITICLIAFIAIAVCSAQIFEHVPHSEDEVAYIFQAKVFAQGHLAVPSPAHRQAFWTPFVLDYQGQRFGKYPPGWPFLLSLGIRLDAPWLVNALLGAATLALIAWLGSCYYPQNQWGLSQVGLGAAGLGVVTPGFLFLSSSLLSHTASLFWSTLTLLGLFYLTSTGKTVRATPAAPPAAPRRLSLSNLYAGLTGLALGALFTTRPFATVGIGLALGLFLLALILRREIKWTLLLWLALGGLAVAALLPLYWWVVTGHPFFNAYLLVWPYDRIGFGPEIGPYGYSFSDALFINTRLKVEALATGLFGWPGWSNLIFLPMPFLAHRANRWDWLLLGTLLSLIFVHIFYWSFGGTDGGFPRYYYDALPALLLLTARGVQISTESLRHFRGGSRLGWLPAGLVIIFIGYNLVWNLPMRLIEQKGKYGITAAQIRAVERANLPKPALIVVKNVKKWSDFAAPFAANSPTLAGPIVYASDEGPELTQKLLEKFKGRSCWELEGETLQPCKKADSHP